MGSKDVLFALFESVSSVRVAAWRMRSGSLATIDDGSTAEVYSDSLGGRYKTIVQPGGDSDSISSSREAFTPGISVDATSRTNIGCYNDGFQSLGPQTIFADLCAEPAREGLVSDWDQ